MTNQNDELDEILLQYANRMRQVEVDDNGVAYTNAGTKAKQQILDWHKREVERVIGEDEPEQTEECWPSGDPDRAKPVDDYGAVERNRLRAEQRKRMEEE